MTDDGTYRIAHIFADTGIEDEVLHTFGEVVRVGIDPEPNPFSTVIQADACDPPLSGGFDLAVAHPKCQRFSKATAGGGSDPEDHPNQIPDARNACQRLADHYIVENVPQAPLHDPVTFTGGMYGMGIHYPRAFETSFYSPQPTRTPRFRPERGPLAEQGKDGHAWVGTNEGWRLAKGYSYDWPARGLKRHAVPAPYLRRLLYWWLAALDADWSGPRTEQTRLATDGGRRPDGTDRKFREELAALEHQQWWEWSETVAREEDVSEERIDRWRGYWVPYEDLPEDVKDHDRKWADRVMELLWNRLVDTGTERSGGG